MRDSWQNFERKVKEKGEREKRLREGQMQKEGQKEDRKRYEEG